MMLEKKSLIKTGSLLTAVVMLAACAPANQDLHDWMDEQRRQTKPRVKPLSEPKQFIPLPYTGDANDALDPYGSVRLTRALRKDSGAGGSGAALMAAELDRRKEPLEDFPLDTMTMVGSLQQGARRVALVRVNGLLHQVRAGNYLGQNFGRVMQVTESEVVLREIVQDAAGEWIERKASLQLQENVK